MAMMEEPNGLVGQFEDNRPRLRKLAYRMLGSESQADDAVQEAWLRLSRSYTDGIDNLAAWLTTVVARICLDMLRSRAARREAPTDFHELSDIADRRTAGPEQEAILSDSIGPALRIVLDTLTPPQRVAFVLHDTFRVSYEEIAEIIERTPAACRQLAHRARHRVRDSASDARSQVSTDRKIVDVFLRAAREGDLHALLAVLHPDCVLRPDEFARLTGRARLISGADNVAGFLNGGGSDIRRATIDGAAGAVWAPNGNPRAAFSFTFKGELIVEIEVIADRRRLAQLDILLLATASR